MTEPKTDTLSAPGAVLHYDVRGPDASPSPEPTLLIIGLPMCADGFVTLAGHFTDRTVVTYDPRGAGRSPRTDGALVTSPDEHADDLHRLISALGSGPVDIFANSGGAVNALALVAQHPEQVRTLVAHEPPAFAELPDRAAALAACDDIHQTYERSGFGPAMAKFIAVISLTGPIPADYADQPAPDPAAFGLRPGRRLAERPAAGPEHAVVPCLRARLRRAPCGARPRRHRGRRGVRADGRPAARARPWPRDWERRRSSSPAVTAGSSAASTATRASPMSSPRRCGRSWATPPPPWPLAGLGDGDNDRRHQVGVAGPGRAGQPGSRRPARW